ncbi:MAG: hypothetical protein HQL97_04555 [Magnetococcales bacterium]|nr:hypothetical protein [Magnetococcales bacterium]
MQLTTGDHGKPLLFTLRDRSKAASGSMLDARNPETWKPCDLTRVRVIHISVRPPGQTETVLLIAARRAPYVNGVCQATWGAELFAAPGQYEGEVRLEYADGSIETAWPRLVFVVREGMS